MRACYNRTQTCENGARALQAYTVGIATTDATGRAQTSPLPAGRYSVPSDATVENFSGEKIQWYLASELRDRIRHSGVSIRVVDRTARAEFKVEPRQFEGRLLHELDDAVPAQSEVYAEIY